MFIHTGDTPFRCNLCEKGFTQNGNLNKHMLIHTGDMPFQCKLCDKEFVQSCSLKQHMLIHTGDRPFQCKLCDKEFTQAVISNGTCWFILETCNSNLKTFIRETLIIILY